MTQLHCHNHSLLKSEAEFALQLLVKAVETFFTIDEQEIHYTLPLIYERTATVEIKEDWDYLELKYFPHRESWCLVAIHDEDLNSDERSLVYQLNKKNIFDITQQEVIEKLSEARFDGFMFV